MKKFGINFNLVLISQIISLLGGNILRFALLLFILDLTQSAGTFGLVTAASQIPVVLFAIPGGIVADRMNKKKLIVFFDGIKTVICALLIALFLSDTYSVLSLTLIIAIFMAIVTLFAPILTAATPVLVRQENLVEATGAIQGINAVSELLSFILGGILLATIGIQNIIILAGIAFFISTFIDFFIQIPFIKHEVKFGIIKTATLDVKESFHYAVTKNPFIIKSALFFAMLALLFAPILNIALPYIVRVQFDASDFLFGISQAVSAFGMLLGSLLSGKVKKWLNIQYFPILITVMALSCLVLAAAVSTNLFSESMLAPFWLFNLTLMVMMVFLTFANITVFALVQEIVPDIYLGKVIALVITIANLTTPIGQFGFGFLMEQYNHHLSILFIIIALLTFGISIIAKKVFKTSIC